MAHRRDRVAGVVAVLLVGAALASPAASPGDSTAEPVKLSDERTFTRWAFVTQAANVHTGPSYDSPVMSELGTRTHDRTRELVLVLAMQVEGNQTWFEVRFKSRPNGQTGWVNSDSLGRLHVVTTFLKINRDKFRATLYKGGERVWSARVGIGKSRTQTPDGDFYVRERLIPRDTRGVYGVYAFGTSATSPTLTDWPGGGIIGIHGTNQPGLIPGRISHGCVRVRNGEIRRLRRLMVLGTPIRIL